MRAGPQATAELGVDSARSRRPLGILAVTDAGGCDLVTGLRQAGARTVLAIRSAHAGLLDLEMRKGGRGGHWGLQ